jgi:hypothetical protein
VESADKLFTNRISSIDLTPNHLRVPQGWDELSQRLDDSTLTKTEKKQIRLKLSALIDPSPAKSGIVRDRELRDQIRKSLRRRSIDPDNFGKDEIKKLIDAGNLQMRSGVPIKSVILLRTNTEPVIIARKYWSHSVRKMVVHDDRRTKRVYIGGNNHHVEILADANSGEWIGEFVSTFDAACRARSDGLSIVNRANRGDKTFVMSLSEGEMIYARRADRAPEASDTVGVFVVSKLDRTRNRIVFAPHWDARRAGSQDRWEVTPAGLRDCGSELNTPPRKVTVDPLGRMRWAND